MCSSYTRNADDLHTAIGHQAAGLVIRSIDAISRLGTPAQIAAITVMSARRGQPTLKD